MVKSANTIFQQAVGGGASGIRMVSQPREVVVRMCVGGILARNHMLKVLKLRRGKG